MKLCPKLLWEVNFEPGSIQPCCDVAGIAIPQFPFTGGVIDIEAYRDHIIHSLELVRKGTMCAGCEQLKESPEQPLELIRKSILIRSVSINHHRFFCNCRCVYCGLWSKKGKDKPYKVLPALEDMVARRFVMANASFHWGGGEPVILPEFDEACAFLHREGYDQYIHTSALKHSQSIDALLASDKGMVNVSLDSGSAQTYRAVKGLDGFGKVCETVGRYIQQSSSPGLVCLKYIIFSLNNGLGEIRQFFETCRRLGVCHVEYSLDFREINTRTVSEKTLLAAACFLYLAKKEGLQYSGFYIPPEYQKRISQLLREHFA